MKDFNRLINESLTEVKEAGITPGNIISWEINKRSKKRWGQCTKTPDGNFKIQISAVLLEDERISEKECKDTIIHEILHACPDGMRHTGKWKQYAELMNRKYGYNIKRLTSGEEKGVENYKSKRLPVKYEFYCRKCGQMIRKKRACKFTKYYRNYTCGICGTSRAFVKMHL